MKFVLLSDTHERHRQIVDVPYGDVLIHSGDFTLQGDYLSIENFAKWLEGLPHPHKILVAGNHDWGFQKNPEKARGIIATHAPSVTYLEDSSCTVGPYKVFGSPWTPYFYDWAFQYRRGDAGTRQWWKMPLDTDILVTHGPSFGRLDLTPHGVHAGCEQMSERMSQLFDLKMHVFGHIHHSYGIIERHGIIYANASICDEAYRPTREPLVVDLGDRES